MCKLTEIKGLWVHYLFELQYDARKCVGKFETSANKIDRVMPYYRNDMKKGTNADVHFLILCSVCCILFFNDMHANPFQNHEKKN